jgi:MFS family permease
MESKSSPRQEALPTTTTQDSLKSVILTMPQGNTELKIEKKSLAFKLAFSSIMASNFIATMDTVIVATALPAIARGLNAKSNEAYWLGSGFLFAQAVSQPLYGTMSSILGRKPCFIFSIALFTVASVFCATAQSVAWLIVARVVCL